MSTRPSDSSVIEGQDSIIIESTLPPATTRELLESEGATVLVFSHDAALAGVIRGVAAERYPIRIFNEWNDLLGQVSSDKGRIVLLDVDALTVEVEDALAEVNQCADWLVLIIAAKQQQAQDFMRFWSERRIHRLLIKPAAAGITRLLLESAFARFIELRELHENTDQMEVPHELVEAEEARHRRHWSWPAIAAVAVVGIGAAIFLLGLFTSTPTDEPPGQIARLPQRSTEPAVEPVADVIESEPQPVDVNQLAELSQTESVAAVIANSHDELLLSAQVAELSGNFVAPPGDNALDYYVSILADAPNHAVARQRLDELLEEQFAIAQVQILDGDYVAANATLDHITRGNPPGTRLQFLREQLNRQRESDVALSNAQQPAVDDLVTGEALDAVVTNEPTELQSMLALLRLRLNEGRLAEPVGDSARDYLRRAIDLGAADDEVLGFAEQFATLATAAIPQSLSAGNVAAASAMMSTVQDLGVQTPALTALEADVAAAMSELVVEENQSLYAQALLRIDAEAYTGQEDSAVALLSQLRERGADATLIADLESQLSAALSQSTRAAIAAGRWTDADALLAVFTVATLELPVVQSLEQDVEVGRRQEQFLAQTIPIGEMTLVEAAPAIYPRQARTEDITGWVDLHFTVATDGATTDIEVVAAEPAGHFEDAAIAALSEYEFAPFELAGRLYERRGRLRMRFLLD